MQPGKGPSEQLTTELAALGSLVTALQQLMDRISTLEVGLDVTEISRNLPGSLGDPRKCCGFRWNGNKHCGTLAGEEKNLAGLLPKYSCLFDFYGTTQATTDEPTGNFFQTQKLYRINVVVMSCYSATKDQKASYKSRQNTILYTVFQKKKHPLILLAISWGIVVWF